MRITVEDNSGMLANRFTNYCGDEKVFRERKNCFKNGRARDDLLISCFFAIEKLIQSKKKIGKI